ncbi:hypothetical protein 6939_0023 [Klebsiella phage 6939]|uniref:Uncharacterized protein n=1 Tax=Klebsiella phage 6939 TaxID=2912295 RepID=A0A9E7SBP5_9CAUD|nr:hypothetical protein 6939_0023 [Klebsiella phage 6939]
MIKLYKSDDGSFIKSSANYKSRYLFSNDGYVWRQLHRVQGDILISTGVYRLIGNNFRRNKR